MALEEALPQSPAIDPTNVWHALTQVLDVGKFFRTYCYRPALDLGFSSNEVDVLLSLKVHPEKNTVKALSETVHLSKGMISQAVESLRKKGARRYGCATRCRELCKTQNAYGFGGYSRILTLQKGWQLSSAYRRPSRRRYGYGSG